MSAGARRRADIRNIYLRVQYARLCVPSMPAARRGDDPVRFSRSSLRSTRRRGSKQGGDGNRQARRVERDVAVMGDASGDLALVSPVVDDDALFGKDDQIVANAGD